mgnify:CR=1 FL=1
MFRMTLWLVSIYIDLCFDVLLIEYFLGPSQTFLNRPDRLNIP